MTAENTYLTGGHHGLADIRHSALTTEIGNYCFTNPAVVIGSGTLSAIDYTAFAYAINGRPYTAATGTDEALTVLDAYGGTNVQAADTTCYYVLLINAAGVEYVVKGKDDETDDLPGYPPFLYTCFGVIKIVTVAVTFTIGTTSFAAAGVTDTFYDCVRCPASAPA